MEYDDILEEVGDFGRYQKFILALVSLLNFFGPILMLGIVFTGGQQDHWCHVPGAELFNLTENDWRNLTIPTETRGGVMRYSQCTARDCNWTSIGRQELDGIDDTSCDIVTCDNRYEYDTSIYQTTYAGEWNLVCGRQVLVATAQSIYMASLMVGNLAFGYMSDWLGRRWTIVVGHLGQLVASLIITWCPNYAAFTALRFLVGFCHMGLTNAKFVLVMELTGPRRRLLSMVIPAYMWSLGAMLLPFMAYYIRHWRYLQFAFCVPLILWLPALLIMPESPRWLFTKNQTEQARAILQKMAKWNRTSPDLENLSEVKVKNKQKEHYLWDFFRYPTFRIRVLAIYLAWFTCVCAYYGITLNATNFAGDPFFNFFISTAVEAPSALLIHLTVDRFGRRTMLCMTMLLAGASLLATAAIPLDNFWALAVLTNLGKFGICAAFCLIYVYTPELFPTVLRNTGLGSASTVGRIGGIISPQIGLLGSFNPIIPLLIFGVLAVLTGGASLLLPETSHCRLPETLEEADKFPRNPRKVADCGEEMQVQNGRKDTTTNEEK